MKCDFHIHSCLSPCSEDDMTPNNIAGMAYVAGLFAIAITDHNCAENLKAIKITCDNYGVKFLAGIEVCTNEDIHILCYFYNINAAHTFSKIIQENTTAIENKTEIYGNQYVVNDNDDIVASYHNLLIVGCNFNSMQVVNLCHNYGGLAFYAHIDKPSYSVLSMLGAIPSEVDIDGIEVTSLAKRDELILKNIINADIPYIISSDSHSLDTIGENNFFIDTSHPLYDLLNL